MAQSPYEIASGEVGEFICRSARCHVGEYHFSLWLVGLTVIAMAAAIGYGFWVGRDRPRAYFGLMLFLTGATVGVFVAQDLLLFYAFFEAHTVDQATASAPAASRKAESETLTLGGFAVVVLTLP